MKEKLKKWFDNNTTRGKILRLLLVLVVLAVVLAVGYAILRATGLWEHVNSVEKIRLIVQKGGAFSFIIFLIFQILQTTVLQIPAVFVTIAGAVIFGRWEAFFLSYLGVMIGSLIMFWIGRKAGRKFLHWLIGQESSEKWIKRMSNGKYLFFLMMLFPMFPDDILCVIAGLTNMSFAYFFWTNLLARGVGIFCTVFFGSGAIIPFHGWGLIVWAIILVVIAVLFYLSVRFKDKIDDILFALTKKSKAKKKDVNGQATQNSLFEDGSTLTIDETQNKVGNNLSEGDKETNEVKQDENKSLDEKDVTTEPVNNPNDETIPINKNILNPQQPVIQTGDNDAPNLDANKNQTDISQPTDASDEEK